MSTHNPPLKKNFFLNGCKQSSLIPPREVDGWQGKTLLGWCWVCGGGGGASLRGPLKTREHKQWGDCDTSPFQGFTVLFAFHTSQRDSFWHVMLSSAPSSERTAAKALLHYLGAILLPGCQRQILIRGGQLQWIHFFFFTQKSIGFPPFSYCIYIDIIFVVSLMRIF